MNIVIERFIELSILEKRRCLDRSERFEKQECLKYLERRFWELAKLKNMSLMAGMTEDVDWQHEICGQIEKLEL